MEILTGEQSFRRFPVPGDNTTYIVCENDEPRIQHCGDYSFFDSQTLTCFYEEPIIHGGVPPP